MGLTSPCRISLTGVVNIHGIKSVVSVLSLIKVEEMLMPSTTIPMDQLMSGCGRLTISTGDNAVKVRRLVIPKSTLTVRLPFINGEVTHSNYGTHIQLVDADTLTHKNVHVFFISFYSSFISFFISEFNLLNLLKRFYIHKKCLHSFLRKLTVNKIT